LVIAGSRNAGLRWGADRGAALYCAESGAAHLAAGTRSGSAVAGLEAKAVATDQGGSASGRANQIGVAGVAVAVIVGVFLSRIVYIRAVVAGVADIVAVAVVLFKVGDQRAVVGGVGEAVVVVVVVAGVAEGVVVGIGLVVWKPHAVIDIVTKSV
jgi:hypothetical protein